MYPTIVSAEWLESHINSPDIRIFDCTFYEKLSVEKAKHMFHKKHIKSSQQLLIRDEKGFCSDFFTKVPLPGTMTSLLTRQGLSRGVHAVLYDRDNRSALRVWWLLQYFSHPKVSILLGGLKMWEEKMLPVELKTIVNPI